MTELIICEKPSAALKIATALTNTKIEEKQNGRIVYYKIKIDNKDVLVVPAVGHLYALKEKKIKGLLYPAFDVEWKEAHLVSKKARFTKDYLDTIKRLCKDCKDFIIATDKDLEGELIGYNIIRFACKQKDAKRMEFSTLTKEDLINSYEKAKEHVDFLLAYSGETRHIMDWIWGINTSRALTLAMKKAGNFKLMSTGRVQGPALNLIVKKEKEIQLFKPTPFWNVDLISDKFIAQHEKGNIFYKNEAENILKNTKGKKAFVKKITKKEFSVSPPFPFDLTSLQVEAYKTLRINPKETLSIAQDLYINGYISYPRTSSQKLPPALNYKKIIEKLKSNKNYKNICSELLGKKELKPSEGKKSDPAHPACHPTGEYNEDLEGKQLRVYDLIVRRFLSAFGDYAKKQTNSIEIDINKEIFSVSGTITLEKGWIDYYGKYAKSKDVELPKYKEGDEIKIKEIKIEDKETQPSKRYTQASIIKELDKKFLGTKGTRAQIIDTLYKRSYIKDNSIQATDLGIKLIDTLEKYSEQIIDEKLTRHFEKEMEQIREGKKEEKDVLDEAKQKLVKIFKKIEDNEEKIGKNLLESYRITQEEMNTIGECPKCKTGNLKILFSRKTKSKFVGCSSYPNCKNIYSLPRNGLIKKIEERCKECNFYQVLVIRAGKRPWKLCLTPNCKSKEAWAKPFSEKALPKNDDKSLQGEAFEKSFSKNEKEEKSNDSDTTKHAQDKEK
ncbi:DNA topoisomerase I [Candidatus Woesearchaeota archaeon]|nr:DNA topoisomerase I [Candidatus Woesearchaeota archaeon]